MAGKTWLWVRRDGGEEEAGTETGREAECDETREAGSLWDTEESEVRARCDSHGREAVGGWGRETPRKRGDAVARSRLARWGRIVFRFDQRKKPSGVLSVASSPASQPSPPPPSKSLLRAALSSPLGSRRAPHSAPAPPTIPHIINPIPTLSRQSFHDLLT